MTAITLPFRPFARTETYRALLFLAAAPAIGALALAILVAGWTASGVLLVTPLVVVALFAFRTAVGLLAAADAALARELLGTAARPAIGSGGSGFWRRGGAVVTDARFWKQQVYLALRTTVGFGFAAAELSLIAAASGLISYPITYRWGYLHLWSWRIDSFARSLVLVPPGIVVLVAAGWLALLLARTWARIVEGLLADPTAVPISRAVRRWALGVHGAVAGGICALLVLVWGLTGAGYFWPEWAIMPLALVLAVHAWVEAVEERPALRIGGRGLATQLGASVALLGFLVCVWALTTRGYFWPVWPALGLAVALVVHLALAWATRGNRLARRVDALELSRAGAVDAEDANLRRIERDLHDGAQARLVALGMTLGLAEQRFASDPEGAQQLVAEARAGVGETLRELRDLARGIHPPVLTDRGLCAALATLADQTGLPVTLSCDLEERLPPAVETAAYFIVAEAVANAAKHSGAERIAVTAQRRGGVLELEVLDDGRGGADPHGEGLTGLRRRALALEGAVRISSPAGGPTVVRAELPCGS